MNFVNKHLAGQAVSAGSWGPTGSQREGVSARRRRLMPLWFIGWLAMVAGLLGAPPGYAQTTVLQDLTSCPVGLGNCTANEVQTTVTSSVALAPNNKCSGPTDTIDVEIQLSINALNASYDFGIVVAKDGGTLNLTPTALACSGATGPIGQAPFVNLDVPPPPSTPADQCGDLATGSGSWTVKATNVACTPVNGSLQVNSCRFWTQSKADACTTSNPSGTSSKCDCTPLSLTNIQFGTLTVIKQLDPTNDPGLFNLTIDNVVNATNVGHDGTTGPVAVTAGQHTVGETAGTNTNLANYDTAIDCTDGSKSTTTSVAGVNVVAGQNTTCTITNTRKATPVCRMVRLRSGGAVTPPGVALFGTGQLNGTCSGTSCSLAINILDGMFNGKGLIYNDGQFPVSGACNAATEECFPTQSNTAPSANPFPTTSPGFDLTNLALTPGNAGGTITFTGLTTYSYTGGKFTSHSGTYTTLDCANTVPEPRTLMLMLPLVLVLLSWSALGFARRSRVRQRSG